jgi:transposase
MNQSRTLDVGMDISQESRAVAYVAAAHHAEVVYLDAIGTRPGDSDPLLRKLPSKSQPLVFGSEAGPCGYGLYRSLTNTGHLCWVVAPSLIPQKAGDRVNTHRRDAIPWACLRRSGDRPPV